MTALFTPMSIGGVALRNRIIMPSMTTRLADHEGYVTDATVAYFKARAAGGTALITVEMASPERVGRHRARELERACKQDGVTFNYGVDVTKFPEDLRDYDRIVVATGAKYRFRCGPIIYWLLEHQWGKSQLSADYFHPRCCGTGFITGREQQPAQGTVRWRGPVRKSPSLAMPPGQEREKKRSPRRSAQLISLNNTRQDSGGMAVIFTFRPSSVERQSFVRSGHN